MSDIHWVGIVVAAVVPLLVFNKSRGRPVLRADVLWCIGGFSVLWFVSSQLLNMYGRPRMEIALPGISAIVVAACVPDQRWRRTGWVAGVAGAVVMSCSFVWLMESGYSNDLRAIRSAEQIKNVDVVKRARSVIETRLRRGEERVVGVIDRDLEGHALSAKVPVIEARWHTALSGLVFVRWEDGCIWATGNTERGRPAIEVRVRS